MEALQSLFVPTGLVALAEIGDKTQLLALLLAARFRRPWPIIWGILVATVANHFAAGAIGKWVASFFSEATLSWILAACFLAVAAWTLIPDHIDEDEEASHFKRYGPFLTTTIAFFIAEMGDKTQIATVMLAAQYNAYLWVVLGTTLGMMLANAPVVWLGDKLVKKVPIRLVHVISALIFLVLGVVALFATGVPGLA